MRPRILFYCQSLVGIGHLTASLEVIRELVEYADVDLIYGGHRIDINLQHSGFRLFLLPTVLINENTGDLVDPLQRATVEQLWQMRNDSIQSFLRPPYNAIIAEFFPFGRRRFKKEILGLFKSTKESSGSIPVFTFVREVLVPENEENEQRMVQLVNDHIHTIFVRGDPSVISFEETFSMTPEIAGKLFYTGYLGTGVSESSPARTNQILVSQGGGSIGKELLAATIQTAPLLPNYHFLIATGAKTTTTEFAHLKDTILSTNVTIVPFLSDFKHRLMQSCLSISMGGDNTLTDVISTRTPSLAFPYPGNSEQDVRINKLTAKGFIHRLSLSEFTPELFKQKIETAISASYPQTAIRMNGAKNMSRKIQEILLN